MDRLLITLLVSGGLALAWLGWQWVKSSLARSISPGDEAAGKPTLLYFSGPYCVACKVQQTPIIEQIAAAFTGAVEVKRVDVTEAPELASKYKVLTLPTTVVINPRGQVTYINYGVTPQTKLESQLLAI
jgi:thioredoxin 1